MASASRAIAARNFMKLFYAQSKFLFWVAEPAETDTKEIGERYNLSHGGEREGQGARERGSKGASERSGKAVRT
jgi:hypothetical protein